MAHQPLSREDAERLGSNTVAVRERSITSGGAWSCASTWGADHPLTKRTAVTAEAPKPPPSRAPIAPADWERLTDTDKLVRSRAAEAGKPWRARGYRDPVFEARVSIG